MKKIFGVLALTVLTTLSAQACDQFEAQFIGKLVKLDKAADSTCQVEIDFSSFSSSVICPLDISDVRGRVISSPYCDKKVGETISGILVDDGEKVYIE